MGLTLADVGQNQPAILIYMVAGIGWNYPLSMRVPAMLIEKANSRSVRCLQMIEPTCYINRQGSRDRVELSARLENTCYVNRKGELKVYQMLAIDRTNQLYQQTRPPGLGGIIRTA